MSEPWHTSSWLLFSPSCPIINISRFHSVTFKYYLVNNQILTMSSQVSAKIATITSFLNSLIQDPQFRPFVDFDFDAFGFLDATFIMKGNVDSLLKIRNSLKNKRSLKHQKVFAAIKAIFVGISDYLLSTDPLQVNCRLGLARLKIFVQDFNNSFVKKSQPSQDSNSARPTRNRKPPNFYKQMEMAYFMMNYERNDDMIREIGEQFYMLEENEDELVIDLSKSVGWTPLVTRTADEEA